MEYREGLAKFAANVYEAVKELTSLNPLYVFSTETFMDIYLEAENSRSIAFTEGIKEQDRFVEKRSIFHRFCYRKGRRIRKKKKEKKTQK